MEISSNYLRVRLTNDQIILGWDKSSDESEIVKTVNFRWMDILFRLTLTEHFGIRSSTIKADLFYLDKEYSFGIGQCSLGAGSFGNKPNITLNNEALKFVFGKHCLVIKSELSNKDEIILDKKREISFSSIFI